MLLGTFPPAPCPRPHREQGLVVLARGRLANRVDLARDLEAGPGRSDEELLETAYLHWGNAAPQRLHGEWVLAAWHPGKQELFLSRDPSGFLPLFYCATGNAFAFASDLEDLLDLVPREMDELYLAQFLAMAWGFQGERTPHRHIRRLPPAHSLTVTPQKLKIDRYWRLEDTPEIRLASREAYAEGLREVLMEAVRSRVLPLPATGLEPMAATLSGGLDSSTVAALAAACLKEGGRRLPAFTSAPAYDPAAFLNGQVGDEFPLAKATADYAGNIDLYPVRAQDISPIHAIREMLEIVGEPIHGAGNAYWTLELHRQAQERGCTSLLTGAMGNGSISWVGRLASHPGSVQRQVLGFRAWAAGRTRGLLRSAAPASWLAARWRRALIRSDYFRSCGIDPGFAQRIDLLDRWMEDPLNAPAASPRQQRMNWLMPGRSIVGTTMTTIGAHFGLEILDPTADARVQAFTVSVPDTIYLDVATRQNRWLIREAMRDRLPDSVRLDRRRGRQAADLALRLRAVAGEVEAAIREVSEGPGGAYLDLPGLRASWDTVRLEDSNQAFFQAGIVLCRAIMAGLWVNRFHSRRSLPA